MPNQNHELTPAQRERLNKYVEEFCESGQAAMKMSNHGRIAFDENVVYNNIDDFEREVGNVLAAIDLLATAGDIDMENVNRHRIEKRQVITKYMKHQGNVKLL